MLNFRRVEPAKSSHTDMRPGVGKDRVQNIFFSAFSILMLLLVIFFMIL